MSDASDDLNFEQIHLVQESLEEDFEIGLVIKNSLIPNAVSWFTGLSTDSSLSCIKPCFLGEIAEVSSSEEDSSECSSNDPINTEEEEEE